MTSNASLSGQGTGQGRPGLEAHYHGREGGFSPPPLLPPSPPSLLAPLLQGQTKPGLISGRHGQTPRQLQEPRYQQPERRPRSFLQPCRPSSCSFWACSRQCHPPAVSKGAHEHSHDRWKQGRWNPGRNRRKVLLDGGQLQVQRARECL
ncbi:PDZK1-interacting protein 1 isoform X1 [Felis catus]|uniref:PDZK1-interacting protein 1 isoform X1 n=1 Tax=Felis catus TaxID=9685 RepID=UPI001D19CDF3|nr:PDZK1-interacting protein 1 isoform X1 [Felis catus]